MVKRRSSKKNPAVSHSDTYSAKHDSDISNQAPNDY